MAGYGLPIWTPYPATKQVAKEGCWARRPLFSVAALDQGLAPGIRPGMIRAMRALLLAMFAKGQHDDFLGTLNLVVGGKHARRRTYRVDQANPDEHRALHPRGEVDDIVVAGGAADLGLIPALGLRGVLCLRRRSRRFQ